MRVQQVVPALSVVVWILGLSYSAAGLALLLGASPNSYPIDLRLRWIEHRLTIQGLNPQLHGHPDPELPASHEGMRTLGGSYPPWSYTIGALFAPPVGWRWAVAHFALLCVVTLATLSRWAYLLLRPEGARYALLAAALPLATFATAICVSYGQYAVIISGLLVVSVVAMQRQRPLMAGLLLGLALVKPQLSATFVLGLACQARWAPAITAGITVAAAWMVTALWVDASPLALLSGMAAESSNFHYLSHNPLTHWLTLGLGRLPAVALLAGAGMVGMFAFSRRLRGDREMVALLSAAIVISMFWSYRRHYDVALMTIPLVYSLAMAVRSGAPWRWALFGAAGLTLWLPIRHTMWDAPAVQVGTLVVWLALLASIWTSPSISAETA